MSRALELKILGVLSRTRPWGRATPQDESQAAELARTGAFALDGDGRLGVFGEPEQIAAARSINAGVVQAIGFATPANDRDPVRRADETLRRMGFGGFAEAYDQDESLGDYFPDPPEAA